MGAPIKDVAVFSGMRPSKDLTKTSAINANIEPVINVSGSIKR